MDSKNIFSCDLQGIPVVYTDRSQHIGAVEELRHLRHGGCRVPEALPVGATIVVIGAGVGLSCVVLAKRHPSARVIAVEPDAEVFSELEVNAKLNEVCNLECFRAAVSDNESEFLSMVKGAAHSSIPVRRSGLFLGARRAFSSPNFRIASFFQRLGIERCDALVVHAQGVELEIIKGLPDGLVGHISGTFQSDLTDVFALRRALREKCERFDFAVRHRGELASFSGARRNEVDLSVVVPVYNVEKYLPKCLDSLVVQPGVVLEILMINDGSPDKSGDVIDSYATRYPSVKHIRQTNGGCASARQNGLSLATGRYVTFVDSDDWVSDNGFAKAIYESFFDSPDLVQFGFTKVYQESGGSEDLDASSLRSLAGRFISEKREIQELLVGQPSIWRRIYRTDFIRHNGIAFDTSIKRFDDLPFQFETLAQAQSLRVIPEAHYFYRLQRPGQDVAITDKRLFVHFEIFSRLFDFVKTKNDSNLALQLMRVYCNTHSWALEKLNPDLKDEYRDLIRKEWAASPLPSLLSSNYKKLLNSTQINFNQTVLQ